MITIFKPKVAKMEIFLGFFWFFALSILTTTSSEDPKLNSIPNEKNETLSDLKKENEISLNDKSTEKFSKAIWKSKTEFLADIFRKKIQVLKSRNEIELVMLIDGSSSIGDTNFKSEMKYIQKVISDINVGPTTVRLAVIIYASGVSTRVNHLESQIIEHEKCSLLHYHLPHINYTGGATNTRDAFLEAERILSHSRPNAQKVVFLVTDGFSNRGNPIPVAERLKRNRVTIYTFGIENGNVEELRRMASWPFQEHSYLFESFGEFEGFERRALHQDLKKGIYTVLKNSSLCDLLCSKPGEGGCCNAESKCSCGILSGHFSCLCPPGFYGSGLINEECTPCPNGTYNDGSVPGDNLVCLPCPDIHQTTVKFPATDKSDCVCTEGYVPDGDKCKVITCPELTPPNNGYFVKKNCSNVLNAACGVRCHVGYTLSGSSIRICQKNGTWSGTKPSCLPKRCEGLKPVPDSDMICTNEEDHFEVVIRYNSTGDKVKHFVKWLESKSENETIKRPKLQEYDVTTNKTIELNYTVDTECNYTCAPGFFMVGSKSRSCLPMLRWSGLKTTCKAIKCRSLEKIENGTVAPENCTKKGLKHHFGEVCQYSCSSGYELKGPQAVNCSGRHGTWTGKNSPRKCIDVEPPKISCPSNITTPTDEGVHFATVTLSLPNATDNSNKEPIVWSKPPFEKDYSLRFIIGVNKVEIYSVDDSGNYAFCSFIVDVKDMESPKILECETPPVFFVSEFQPNSSEIKWKEPVVDDNSGVPIPLERNPSTSEFPLGTTTILYTAKDSSGNNASCTLNITILENPCSQRPEITNTQWNCSTNSNVTTCNISCSEGFAFSSSSNSSLELNCTYTGRKASWTPDLFHGDIDLFPECSQTEAPSEEIFEEIVIDGSDDLCNDLETLSNDIINEIGGGQEIDKSSIFTVCEEEPSEEEKKEEKLEEDTNVIRRKRAARKKKLRIGFTLKGNSSTEEINKDIHKAKEKVREFSVRHGETEGNGNQTFAEPVVRTKVRWKCKDGSLLKRNICVKCPKGTFHNTANSTCDPCPVGEYQEVEGQVACIPCPEGYSTRKIRRKNSKQCKKICPPGTFGRKKQKAEFALAPCSPCPVGHYQPFQGQTSCVQCPEEYTTSSRGSVDADKCVRKSELEDLCFRFYCRHGGTCIVSDGFALCKCAPGFLGAFCEKRFNPCASSPCYNSGECIVTDGIEYVCKCPGGFEGEHCEREINECSSNPCGNHGECIDLFDAFRCNCFSGYKGDTCNERISQCEDLQPCMNSGTCIDVNASYKCLCAEGYTGAYCEEPLSCNSDGSKNCDTNEEFVIPEDGPCQGITCGENMQCQVQWNRQPLCICREGLRGENCTEVINPRVVLNFPKYGVTEYLSADFPPRDLWAISICVWIRTKDNFNYGTLFSYSTPYDDNAFTLTDYSGLVLYASGHHVVTDLTANDGFWHFICVTWESQNGQWIIYLDGSIHSSGNGLANNYPISGGGKLVVGQEQDLFGGGFNEVESFSGRLTYFDIWDRVLQPLEIKKMFESCDDYNGNLITWTQLLQNIHGAIQEEESNFCKTCQTNLELFRGKITYEHINGVIGARYECNEGYYLRFEQIIDSDIVNVNYWFRKCLKHGSWEWKEPKCSRVSCGFPGYFLNGKISGNSYLYGDVLSYRCDEGHTLMGNDTRVCQSDGSWSGETPFCKGNSDNCRKLVAPRHGSMFVYFSSGTTYKNALPSIGDRIEFTCDRGYRLRGFGMLTCLSGGFWDREPPSCQEIRCQYPKEASNLLDKVIPPTATFNFGDLLIVTCSSGTQKVIACDEFGSWNFSTSTCKNQCSGIPNSPQNGYILHEERQNSDFDLGAKLFIKCKPGFLLMGDNHFLCSQNGVWRQSQPTICTSFTCGPPPLPPHPYYIAHEQGYNLGEKVYLECVPGYYKTGEMSTTCEPSGRWSRIQNTCIKNP